jgi:RES domain
VLYAGDTIAGSIAEAFGRFDSWDADVIEADPARGDLPGSRYALATYEIAQGRPICNLDDPAELQAQGLRPSRVVTRDRSVTQAWATSIYESRRFAGVSWWSYYEPEWRSLGIWDLSAVTIAEPPRIVRLSDVAVAEAARTICRRFVR